MKNTYAFDAEIKKVSGMDGAYIEIPLDNRSKIGKQTDASINVTITERER